MPQRKKMKENPPTSRGTYNSTRWKVFGEEVNIYSKFVCSNFLIDCFPLFSQVRLSFVPSYNIVRNMVSGQMETIETIWHHWNPLYITTYGKLATKDTLRTPEHVWIYRRISVGSTTGVDSRGVLSWHYQRLLFFSTARTRKAHLRSTEKKRMQNPQTPTLALELQSSSKLRWETQLLRKTLLDTEL